MKTWTLAARLLAVGFTLSTGCVTTTVTEITDRLPESSPRGYAEFYAANDDSLGLWIAVYERQGTKYFTDGSFGGRERLRVACAPGETQFFIEANYSTTKSFGGTQARVKKDDFSSDQVSFFVKAGPLLNVWPVKVQVHEAMVTPVRLTMKEISKDISGPMATTKFSINIDAESPQPATNYAYAASQTKPDKRDASPTAIPSDTEDSASVKSITADPETKPENNLFIVMTPIAALSLECVKEGVTRGEFESRVRSILKKNNVKAVQIVYTDGAQKIITQTAARVVQRASLTKDTAPDITARRTSLAPGTTEDRVSEVKNISDQAKLADIAMADQDKNVRKTAVGALTDQTLIAKVAAEAEDGSIRKDAVQKIKDQKVLVHFAIEDKDYRVRMEAVNNVASQDVLDKIAISDTNLWVRRVAVERLTNQVVLSKVALGDDDTTVRLDAIKRLKDQSTLARIAIGDKNLSVRRTAVKRITAKELLREVAKTAEDEVVRRIAGEQAGL